jgi:DNA-binding transcriptional ArsR family regulator
MQRKEATRCLKALANARRVRIIDELLSIPGLSVGDLKRILKLSYPSISRHLQRLADCDLVVLDQRSLNVYCRVNRKHPAIQALLRLTTS